MNREWVNRLLVLVATALLGVVAGMLFLVGRSYRESLERTVEATVEMFESSGELRAPDDRQPNFAAMEGLARRAESPQHIERVYVVRRVAGGDAVLVHPFWYGAVHPDWRERLGALRREPLQLGVREVGELYIELDTGPLRMIQGALGATLAMTVVLLALLVARILTQERVLTQTNQVLEDNRRELVRIERLALAGLLTANILHDIRKPVTNIKHELSDLSEALGGFAGATRALRNMRDQVNLFFDILTELNLERFVRNGDGDMEYVDLNRVAE